MEIINSIFLISEMVLWSFFIMNDYNCPIWRNSIQKPGLSSVSIVIHYAIEF